MTFPQNMETAVHDCRRDLHPIPLTEVRFAPAP